jgi:hypothetical protein
MSKIKVFEMILSAGFKLAIMPINYLIAFGTVGRILSFFALIFYSMPILIIFNVIGFTFWAFKK